MGIFWGSRGGAKSANGLGWRRGRLPLRSVRRARRQRKGAGVDAWQDAFALFAPLCEIGLMCGVGEDRKVWGHCTKHRYPIRKAKCETSD